MSAFLFYVCDRCGNQWRAYRAISCPACRHLSIWAFERAQPAREHAARIDAERAREAAQS